MEGGSQTGQGWLDSMASSTGSPRHPILLETPLASQVWNPAISLNEIKPQLSKAGPGQRLFEQESTQKEAGLFRCSCMAGLAPCFWATPCHLVTVFPFITSFSSQHNPVIQVGQELF